MIMAGDLCLWLSVSCCGTPSRWACSPLLGRPGEIGDKIHLRYSRSRLEAGSVHPITLRDTNMSENGESEKPTRSGTGWVLWAWLGVLLLFVTIFLIKFLGI